MTRCIMEMTDELIRTVFSSKIIDPLVRHN
jgi:hypothetical protein